VLISLGWAATAPFEYGVTIACTGSNATAFLQHTTSWTTTQDPCATALFLTANAVAAAHSHPLFQTANEYRAGTGCRGDTSLLTASQLAQVNSLNANFSPGDIDAFRSRTVSLYLRTPNGNAVRKLQGSSSGSYSNTLIYSE
jgi:hypothetical protein